MAQDKDAGTPRVFLVRHGETEWTISGRYTGSSDIPLTTNGEKQITLSSHVVVGPAKIIDPSRIARLFVSPRQRARRTYELLFDDATRVGLEPKVEIAQEIREWEYGFYEGLLPGEIRKGRKQRGFDGEREWNIWKDGCEGGEAPEEVAARLDCLVQKIKEIQKPFMHGEDIADVVIIAHGHSLRAFAKRWIGFDLGMSLPMMLEPGAVGVLSYEHHSIDEPAFLLGVNMGAEELEKAKEQV